MCILCDIYFTDGLIGAEIGVLLGDHARQMVKDIPIKELYLIDSWEGEGNKHYEHVKTTFAGDERIKIIKKKSTDAVQDFPDEYFDFVYIDANHEYFYVKADINAWYPKVKKGGMLLGDDIECQSLGDKETVIHAVRDSFKNFIITGPSWLVIKDKENHCNRRGFD